MGFERHSIHSTLPADVVEAIGPVKVVECRPADVLDMTPGDTARTGNETRVWRQARQMRDEWRRERYSRLTSA
jgi:hypothetical protein